MKQAVVQGKKKVRISVVVQTIIAVVVTIVMSFPVYWVFVTALKGDEEMLVLYPTLWPKNFHWDNFLQVFERIPLLRYFWNTIFVTVCHVVLQVGVGLPAAYAFARGRFKGRDIWFLVVLGAMMIPHQVTFLPVYSIIAHLGWVDTYAGLIFPGTVSAYFIFMMRQNFRSVDQSYLDAGRVDGLGILGTLRYILLPMCKSSVVTVTMVSFINGWNSYFWPKLLCQSDNTRLLTVGIVRLKESWSNTSMYAHYNVIFSGLLLSIIPVIIVFLTNQKHMMTGYSKAAMK